ncbi:MAG: PLP-dependent transferase [Rhodospirillales bacterium]|nr:PLP-dependent transferase [Rhodospirillales bacterium]
MTHSKNLSPDTLLAQASHYIDEKTGALTPAIQPSTTFGRDSNYDLMGDYIYGRNHNPTFDQVEKVLCELEGGAEARLFASGQAAITALFETVAQGRHIVAPDIMYHGAQAWMRRLAQKRGIELTLFDARSAEGLANAVRPGQTDIVWIETLLNPTWDVMDIAKAADIAHAAGALLGVDATVTPPVTTRALGFGADIVFHSATKYLNGHSDVLGGVLITRTRDQRWAEVCEIRTLVGGIMGPFEAWLLLRGMRTLGLRCERAFASAARIAHHFEGHAKLDRVLYPGLESHPGHALAASQMTRGFGGMLSFLVKGDAAMAKALIANLQIFIAATSLGGVESLVEHRATVEGPQSLVPENLIRISVGIESADDLIGDLEQAFDLL